VTWAIRGVIMERERGQWGSDEGEEGKKGERSVCIV
jgi:hypothetical protein